MRESNLLASVALFSELYNSEHYENITDIIAEFIKAVVVSESKWSTNASEITYLLEKVYGFKIPESVVKSTLRNRLKGVAQNLKGTYHFNNDIKKDYEKIDSEYLVLKENQQHIITQLFDFINVYRNESLSEKEMSQIEDNFQKFLMDNGVSEKYTDQISAFVIKNSKDVEFRKNLNLIREGIILYQGVRYSSDLSVFGVWNTDLTIFLGPEHLLSALGFNGLLFEELFDDFYKLVNEINHANKNRGNDKRVTLKYFAESLEEVDSLFHSAEQIINGKAKLITHKTAMKEIINGCRFPSDIVNKKAKFHQNLKQKGIILQEFRDGELYKYADYNVEDKDVIESIKKQSIEKTGNFDEDACHKFFRIFTKINYFRGGQSREKFENIGCIYITNNSQALFLAHNNRVKFKEHDIAFAKDIDYITNKFWFKLRKGLSLSQDFPKSFDVVTKAQIIISSHIQTSILHQYEKLQEDVRTNKLSEKEAIEINFNLREKVHKPEDITPDTIDNSLAFLSSDDLFHDIIIEKERKERMLDDSQKKIAELQAEIARRDEIEQREKEEQDAINRVDLGNDYIKEQQILLKGKNRADMRYLFFTTLITIIPTLLTVLFKVSHFFEEWIKNLGDLQWFVWGGLVMFQIIEIIARSYLINKEKVKNGWFQLVLLFNASKRKQLLFKQREIWISEFQTNN